MKATLNPPPAILVLALLASACTGPHPLSGGKAVTRHAPAGIEQTLTQGENASAPSRQDQDRVTVRTYTLPPGTRIEQPAPQTDHASRITHHALSLSRSNAPTAFTLPAPVVITERDELHAATQLGAAQKDTAREFTAKLSSLKGIVWVGLALFVFGIASAFWPPLKAIIGSLTTSAAIAAGGLALMVLPSLVVGNELLILAGVALAVGGWFLAHRHGHLRGQVAAFSRPPAPPKSDTGGPLALKTR